VAATVPLTGSHRRSLAIIGAGPFGERTARLLLETRVDGVRVAASDVMQAFSLARQAVVIAMWRTEPMLLDRAEHLSRLHGLPWLPIVMEYRAIRIGPLVAGDSACFRCYQRRREQHDVQPDVTAALQQASANDRSFGPQGFLPHHTRMAAMLACEMLRPLDRRPGGIDAGHVATIRIPGDRIRVNEVVRCYDCDRCGGPAGPAGDLHTVIAKLHCRRASNILQASSLGGASR